MVLTFASFLYLTGSFPSSTTTASRDARVYEEETRRTTITGTIIDLILVGNVLNVNMDCKLLLNSMCLNNIVTKCN